MKGSNKTKNNNVNDKEQQKKDKRPKPEPIKLEKNSCTIAAEEEKQTKKMVEKTKRADPDSEQ
jgi:hypothetical protein